jgi:hypothetical protein
MGLLPFELFLAEVSNQLDQRQQELSLLCLKLLADNLQLLHRALILQVLQVPVEFQNVDSLIELGHSLLPCLELVDVQLFALKQ